MSELISMMNRLSGPDTGDMGSSLAPVPGKTTAHIRVWD
jgi:hypothetical protein